MIGNAQKILAGLAVLLGIGHLVFGIIVYKEFSLDMLWFLGAGIAMIVTALANFRNDKIWILRVQNVLMLGFIMALAVYVPQPQVWLGIGLFASLLGLSFFKRQFNTKA